MDINIEERVQRARDLHAEGYNCSQAVFLAYSDLFGIDKQFAAVISAPLGGGIGRLREVCGSVCAMSLLAGQIVPVYDPADKDAKARNYALVQEFANKFREKNGAIVCRELLGLNKTEQTEEQDFGRITTKYQRKSCREYVADAARIVGEKLIEEPLAPKGEKQ